MRGWQPTGEARNTGIRRPPEAGVTRRRCQRPGRLLYWVVSMAISVDKTKIESCVEMLCLAGCRRVTEFIDVLSRGDQLPETAGLSDAEREAVLSQLQEIMAVYQARKEWPGQDKPS
jgi:hypothetical protein